MAAPGVDATDYKQEDSVFLGFTSTQLIAFGVMCAVMLVLWSSFPACVAGRHW